MSTLKKILFTAITLFFIAQEARSQSVGIGTETPNPNAVLELVSPNNNQGLLVPKMTTAQRTANAFTNNLSSTENGLLVYDTDENAFYFWMGDQWVAMQSNVDITAGDGIDITDGEISNTGDLDPTNEIQDLDLTGNTLTITGNGSATPIDLTPFAGTNTDEQNLEFSGGQITLTGDPDATVIDLSNYDSDATDDFSGDYNDLANQPTLFSGDFSDLSNVPANLDTDATDDFSGDFGDLTNIPANLDTDATDDVTLTTSPDIAGDIIGDFALGLIVDRIGGETALDVANAAAFINSNPNIDTDAADDITLTTAPNVVGDVAGDFQNGLIVDQVGGQTAIDVANATAFVNANPNIDTDATDDFSGDFGDLTNVPVNLDTDVTDDFSGDFGDLANVPADLADGDDVNDADADATNEIQDLDLAGNILTITGNGSATPIDLSPFAGTNTDEQNLQFSGGQITLTGDPDATVIDLSNYDTDASDDFDGQFSSLSGVPANLDTDATDDFSGDYNDLTNQPTLFSGDFSDLSNIPANLDTDATDDFSGDFGDLTNVPANLDTDATDDFSGDFGDLTNVPVNIDTDATDDFSGDFGDLTNVPVNLDIDATDDFSGDFGDLANVPADLADGDDVNDADADATNEIQDLDLAGNILTITGNGSATPIDLSPFAGTNTDEQNLQFSGGQITLTGDPDATVIDLSNYDTDATDDFDGQFSSLTGVPANLDTDATDDFSGDFGDLTNMPANLDTDATDDFSGDFGDLTNVPVNLDIDATDDFSGDFGDLANVPADLADGDDVNDADADATNEIQDLDLAGNILTITGNGSATPIDLSPFAGTNTDEQNLQFSGGQITLTGDPDATVIDLSNYDTDATDDFSGDFGDLTNLPANLDTDATDDFSGDFGDLTNVPVNLDTDATDDFSGDFGDLTNVPVNLDTDVTDDFSGDFGDLANIPADLADGDDVNDADADATNEIQDLDLAGNILTITGNGSATPIDLSPFAGTNTDEQNLQFSGGQITLTGDPDATVIDLSNYDTDATDDFDGQFSSLTGVPANLDTDATDDFSGDFGDLSNIPANLDTDATDDFSGDFGDLTNVPANLDTDATDDFSGDFGDLANVPADLADGDDVNDADADATNEIQDLDLAGNILTITGNGSATPIDLSPFAGTNTDEQNLQFSGGQITLTGDPDATVIDLSNYDTDASDDFDGQFSSLAGVPANLDTDATDDFSGDFGDLTNVPVNLDTDATDDFSGDYNDLTNQPTLFSGDFSDLSNVPANLDTDATDDFSGDFGDLTNVPVNLDIDATDDFSGDFGDLTNVPADLADGDDVNDADSDPDNETIDVFTIDGPNLLIREAGTDFTVPVASLGDGFEANTDEQDLDFTGGQITLTGDPDATVIDLSNYDSDASDDFDGQFSSLTGVPANLDIDATDDFSGDFGDLTNVPVNLDTDATDDFSGDFADLTNVPADLADGDDVDDSDADPNNEIISDISLTGTLLEITEPGTTNSIDLVDLVGTDDQNSTEVPVIAQNGVIGANVQEALEGVVSGLGSAAGLNAGTGPNQVVQLEADGSLPALDASNLTDVNLAFPFTRSASVNASNNMFDLTNTGTGITGVFDLNNASATNPALRAFSNGTGPVVQFDHGSSASNNIIADFRSQGTTQVTIRDDGQVSAGSFVGDGSGLTNVPTSVTNLTSNISFDDGSNRSISVLTPSSSGTDGDDLTVSAGTANGVADGGDLNLSAGDGGSITGTTGGDVILTPGFGSDASGVIQLNGDVEGINVSKPSTDGTFVADFTKNSDGGNSVIRITDNLQGVAAIEANRGIIIGDLGSNTAGSIRFDGSTFEGNTDGTAGGWVEFGGAGLPPQMNNDGRFLSTDGFTASWVDAPSSPWNATGNDLYYTTGQVAVGTTLPTSQLSAHGTVSAGANLNEGVFIDAVNQTGVSGDMAGIRFKSNASVGNQRFNSAIFYRPNSAGELNFAVQTNNAENVGSNDIKMTIESSGEVGIGTENPASLLDIQDNSTSVNNQIDVYNGNDTGDAAIRVGVGSGFGTYYTLGVDNDAGDVFKITNGTSLGASNDFVINNAGEVGIGVLDPNSELDVNGTVTASAFVGDGSGLTNLPASSSVWTGTGEINYTRSGVLAATNTAVSISNTTTTSSTAFYTKTGLRVESTGSFGGDATSDIIGIDVDVDGPGNKIAGRFTGGALQTEEIDASGAINTPATYIRTNAPIFQVESSDDSNDAYARFITSNTFTIGVDQSDNSFKIAQGFIFSPTFDRFTIDSSGDVGIATSTPSAKLDVVGTSEFNGNVTINGTSGSTPHLNMSGINTQNSYTNSSAGLVQARNFSTSGGVGVVGAINQNNVSSTGDRIGVVGLAWYGQSNNYGVRAYGFGGNTAYGIYAQAGGATTNYAGFFSGNVRVSGNIEYTGTISDVSDRRLKENFKTINQASQKLDALKGYSYNLIEDSLKVREYGLIAQDVQKVLPHAVSVIDKENGYLGLAYTQLIPVLVEAHKEQQTELESLQEEVERLRKSLASKDKTEADLRDQLNKQASEIALIKQALGLDSSVTANK